jgi:hypothetical protein
MLRDYKFVHGQYFDRNLTFNSKEIPKLTDKELLGTINLLYRNNFFEIVDYLEHEIWKNRECFSVYPSKNNHWKEKSGITDYNLLSLISEAEKRVTNGNEKIGFVLEWLIGV